MKKLITIAAAAAVLGAGICAEPAKASQQLMERYNNLVHRGNALASKGQAPSTAWCKIEQEKVAILKATERSGGHFERNGSPGSSGFKKALSERSTNVRLCSEKGYLPRPRTAPIAQNQPSRTVSAQGMTLKQMADYQTQRTIRNCGYPNDSRAYPQCKDQSSNMGFAEMFLGF